MIGKVRELHEQTLSCILQSVDRDSLIIEGTYQLFRVYVSLVNLPGLLVWVIQSL